MNQLQALRDTISVAAPAWELSETFRRPDAELTLDHAREMLRRVEEAPDAFSPAKLGRWLGWVQAAAVAAGALSLEQSKIINRMNSKDPEPVRPDRVEVVVNEKRETVLDLIKHRMMPTVFKPTARGDIKTIAACEMLVREGILVHDEVDGRSGYRILNYEGPVVGGVWK